MNYGNPYRRYPLPGMGYLSEQQAVDTGIRQDISWRDEAIRFLLDQGEPYWLPVELHLDPTGVAQTVFTSAQDFNLLVVGATANVVFSTVQIRDSARNRNLTGGPVQIHMIANWAQAAETEISTSECEKMWAKPYFLAARGQFQIVAISDGVEEDGYLTFSCLMPPITSI